MADRPKSYQIFSAELAFDVLEATPQGVRKTDPVTGDELAIRDPILDSLHDEPAYRAILARLNLTL